MKISIHAPTRGATNIDLYNEVINNISIHAPTRGATGVTNNFTRDTQDFNPRSYKRSDDTPTTKETTKIISIHAPTRGATDTINKMRTKIKISIHAPTRGATNTQL